MLLLHLLKRPYEPLAQASLKYLTRKTAVLLTLASAKRGAEVHAFSSQVLFGQNYSNVTLHYIPGFIAKTQVLDRPETTMAPVIIPALSPTVERGIPDRDLCPVRALRYYLERTQKLRVGNSQRLFLAYKEGHKGDIVKQTVAGWMKATIREAYSEIEEDDIPLTSFSLQVRELRAMSTSLAFHQTYSLAQVMSAAQWRSQGTFAQFYYRDCPLSNDGLQSIGPIVAAQTIVNK